MERIVIFDGEAFITRYFLDVDSDFEGVDIYYVVKKSSPDEDTPFPIHVGFIEDICLPDEDDNEQTEMFDKIICEWLKTQDANYLLK